MILVPPTPLHPHPQAAGIPQDDKDSSGFSLILFLSVLLTPLPTVLETQMFQRFSSLQGPLSGVLLSELRLRRQGNQWHTVGT